jgi:protein-S-isoprenylcysteine O-methyltransferase Ste14
VRDPGLLRAAALFGPAAVLGLLWHWRPPGARERAAVLLACCWNFAALAGVQALAARAGWWRFDAQGGLFLGIPVDLLLGWTVLWGAVPILALPRAPLPIVIALAGWLDLLLMPRCQPVVVLGAGWLRGEALALAGALLPSLLLARWTSEDRRLAARAMLQMLLVAGLLLGVLPAAILEGTGGSWSRAFWSSWQEQPREAGLWLQVLGLAALPGLSAVQEFVERGRGTPLPFDAPRRLVTTGLYRYIANPMQVSLCLVLGVWGAALASAWVAAGALIGAAFFAGLADWDEHAELAERHGAAWRRYREAVRCWWPRWRPFVASPARLYVAQRCDVCSPLAVWLEARRPVGLELRAAEDHTERDLVRLTYDPGDGMPDEEGLAALGRALEHLDLGWALVGAALRLPLVRPLLQVIVDGVGGGPRVVRRTNPARPRAGNESGG